jgi:Ni/Fe-hydrogenase subunit HybB-like protein
VVRVGIGLVAPLILLTWPGGRRHAAVFVACCLTLVGIFVDRLQFVTAGQISPAGAASGQVAVPYTTYSPSLIEIGIVIGACAVSHQLSPAVPRLSSSAARATSRSRLRRAISGPSGAR